MNSTTKQEIKEVSRCEMKHKFVHATNMGRECRECGVPEDSYIVQLEKRVQYTESRIKHLVKG